MTEGMSQVIELRSITKELCLDPPVYHTEFIRFGKKFKTVCEITSGTYKIETTGHGSERKHSIIIAAELMRHRLEVHNKPFTKFEPLTLRIDNKDWEYLCDICWARGIENPQVFINGVQQYKIVVPEIHFVSRISTLSLCVLQTIPHVECRSEIRPSRNKVIKQEPRPKKVYVSSDEESVYEYSCGHRHKISEGKCDSPVPKFELPNPYLSRGLVRMRTQRCIRSRGRFRKSNI